MTAWMMLGSLATAFLIGSIPFSMLVARGIGGIDLRQQGSGNVGATNVARSMGAKWGALALLLDGAKGVGGVLLCPLLFAMSADLTTHQRVLCGIAAVLGHMFTPWLRFRGGKGVATALGAVAVLAPLATLISFGVFALSFALKRIVSLSSIAASVAFPIAQTILQGAELWSPGEWSLGLFSVVVPLLIIVRHHTNIGRLIKGQERPLDLKRRTDASE